MLTQSHRHVSPALRNRSVLSLLAVLSLILLSLFPAAAQEAPEPEPAQARESLPRGFRRVRLGMTLAEVQEALKADELFFYRGAPDVSLLPRPDEKLLEVQGLSYVRRAFFQFYEERLFSAVYFLDTEKIDHYSVFTRFSERYGMPVELSPRESVWTDGIVRVSIERPLSVKYVDVAVLEKLKKAGEVRKSWEELSRQDFLESF